MFADSISVSSIYTHIECATEHDSHGYSFPPCNQNIILFGLSLNVYLFEELHWISRVPCFSAQFDISFVFVTRVCACV